MCFDYSLAATLLEGVLNFLAACHLLVYDMEVKTYKYHVNGIFVWIPVSSWWHYGYDTVPMHGAIQGEIVYLCDEFGVDGKLYVEGLDALWRRMKMDRTMTPTMFDVGKRFW